MSSKKWLTVITFVITIALIPLILIFDKNSLKIEYDIALAIFGGSSMGFLMTLVEYFSERRKAMEEFWNEGYSVLRQLRKAQYIHFDEPEELVIASIKENESNKYLDELGESACRLMDLRKTSEAKIKYIQWLKEHMPMNFSEADDQKAILETMYSNKVKRNEILIERVIESYIELSQISLSKLDNAYGNLNFIFLNHSIRSMAYDDIYDRVRDIRNKILKAAVDFNLWKNDEGNFAVCAEKALEISHSLFVEVEKSSNGIAYRLVYQNQFDEIEDSLEVFRTKIYIGTKNESIEHRPVMGQMINSKDKSN